MQRPGVELTAKGSFPLSALRATPADAGQGTWTAATSDAIDLRIQSTRIDLGTDPGLHEPADRRDRHVPDGHPHHRLRARSASQRLRGHAERRLQRRPSAASRFSGMTTRIELADGSDPRPETPGSRRERPAPDHRRASWRFTSGSPAPSTSSIESERLPDHRQRAGELNLETHLKLTGEVRQPRLEGEAADRRGAARGRPDPPVVLESLRRGGAARRRLGAGDDDSPKGADEATRDALARGREIGAEKAARSRKPRRPAVGAADRHLLGARDGRPRRRARQLRRPRQRPAARGPAARRRSAASTPRSARTCGSRSARTGRSRCAAPRIPSAGSTSSRDGGSPSSAAARCSSTACRRSTPTSTSRRSG